MTCELCKNSTSKYCNNCMPKVFNIYPAKEEKEKHKEGEKCICNPKGGWGIKGQRIWFHNYIDKNRGEKENAKRHIVMEMLFFLACINKDGKLPEMESPWQDRNDEWYKKSIEKFIGNLQENLVILTLSDQKKKIRELTERRKMPRTGDFEKGLNKRIVAVNNFIDSL